MDEKHPEILFRFTNPFARLRLAKGYGWFSVSPADMEVAASYVKNQKEHHRKVTFEDEFRGFLRKYRIEFDERYVWD